jgi:cyclohexadienyl dehydratase
MNKTAFIALSALLGLTLLAPVPATAGAVQARVKASGTVRVCIWPDYYGITYRSPRTQQLTGIDIDMANEFGKSAGAKVAFVDSSFAKLVEDLGKDRCDVAMMAVAITPQRQQVLRFTQPTLRGDIYGITTKSHRVVREWGDIDKRGVTVAVQAGTFMESVMAERLKNATLLVVRPPATREQELEAGRADVFMTDYPYSRRMLDNADWARLVSPPQPFFPVTYAYAVKPGDDDWLKSLDAFVAAAKRDGRLEAAAQRHGLSAILVRD